MNPNTPSRKWSWIQLDEGRAARTGMLLLLLLLTLPAEVQAQFTYTINNGGVTITGYNGVGGAVIIPDTINGVPVIGIGDYAFQGCASLTSITIPNSVTSIGWEAFIYCTSLTSVTIGNSVTEIGPSAFFDCTRLTNATIPMSVSSIGIRAFTACSSLGAIAVDALNPFYSSLDGILFDKNQTTLIQCPGAKAGSYTIPNSVTSIGDSAFRECTSLASVTIGDSVFSIGKEVFQQCSSLTNVTMGDSIRNIDDWAFVGCEHLNNVTIGTSVTNIGMNAFALCSSMTSLTIPNSVTSVGEQAFWDCENLTTVTIGAGVTNIDPGAFGFCDRLSTIIVDALNAAFSTVDGVLFNKNQTTLVEYPGGKGASYTIPNAVTTIGQFAFPACTGLTNVTMPNSVTSIEGWAFSDCSGLISITMGSGLTTIEDYAFSTCPSLSAVNFKGNAPCLGGMSVFEGDNDATVYYLPGTTGWGLTYGGRPTALWIQVPTIQTPPRTQTAEAGSAVGLWVRASSPLPLFYLWDLNDTNLISCGTNWYSLLTNVQFAQTGAYTVVVSNVLGTATSAPAMLNVIAPVERRPIPGFKVTGEAGSLLNVDCADSLSPAPNWTPLGSVGLTGASQYCFDLTVPLPAQRFYRAWQVGTPGVRPSLDLHMVPAITLTGSIGHSVRVDGINQFGPIDAWSTMDTVTLTNTSQLYFDVFAPGQPQRLYRLVQVP